MISAILGSVFGLPYQTSILVTTIVAALAMTLAMIAVVFFAWAPYLSRSWGREFGSDTSFREEDAAD